MASVKNISFDMSDFMKKAKDLLDRAPSASEQALFGVGGEIMRLSSFEVPHDKGLLQNSGSVEPEEGGVIIGYNKVYAARLHEHPEYRFQKGRKGKYLEDPIKNNLAALGLAFADALKGNLI